MTLSLKKDFLYTAPQTTVNLPNVGEVIMHDVGMEHSEALRRFYTKNYRPGYILENPKLFNWMFRNNGGKVAVASHNNVIVAHQGHIPVVFTDGEKDYRGFISASTMVDAEYRRRGLMSYLRNSVQGRYKMAVSLGGSNQGIALYSAMGYKRYGDLTRLVAILNPRVCTGVSKETHTLTKTLRLPSTSLYAIRPIDTFADCRDMVDSLWSRVFAPRTYLSVKRDAEFLDWRYTDHPLFVYQRFGAWQNGVLQAVLIYREEQVPSASTSVVRITELFGEESAMQEVVAGALFTPDMKSRIGWIDWFSSHAKINTNLRSLGFVTPQELMPAVIPILCNPLDYKKTGYPLMFWSKDEQMHATMPPFAAWYITKGDGDADRPN